MSCRIRGCAFSAEVGSYLILLLHSTIVHQRTSISNALSATQMYCRIRKKRMVWNWSTGQHLEVTAGSIDNRKREIPKQSTLVTVS
jgi:hypothetical protein